MPVPRFGAGRVSFCRRLCPRAVRILLLHASADEAGGGAEAMSGLVIFDDRDHVAAGEPVVDLSPLDDLRAVFDVRTGMLKTRQRLARQWPGGLAALWVPRELEAVAALAADTAVNLLPEGGRFLCVNGRWIYPAAQFDLPLDTALIEEESGHVVAVHLERDGALDFLGGGTLPPRVERHERAGRFLLRRPWEILAALPQVLHVDLLGHAGEVAKAAPPGVTILGEGPVMIDPTARVMPQTILDAENGPIVIDAHALVRPGATIIGPAYVGEHSQILDRALIKANTSIGPWCKVAGEVGATIFQGYANKAHDGHLGDSWIGQWVNLGAGTVNSNLLNTYGEVMVRQRVGGSMSRTGMQFLGSFIGDHVKTAIGTRLMTGSVIGTGAMIATTAPPPACVAPFAWLTDEGHRRYRIDKFIEVARAVMARRRVELTGAMELRLRALYDEAAT